MTRQQKVPQAGSEKPNRNGGLATITVLTSISGNITKTIYRGDDGKPIKESTPNFSAGTYKVINIASMTQFKKLRNSLLPTQALMFSTPIDRTTRGIIATKKRKTKSQLSRSLDCFAHPKQMGVMPLDYDPRDGLAPYNRDQLYAHMVGVAPMLRNTQVLWATSAGSCVYDLETGEVVYGIKGQRFYFMVIDASDIPRAMKVLAERLWLAGQGYIKVSKAGQKLKRTPIDLALANAVQPDFAAGAVCLPPYDQRSQMRLIGTGGALDTHKAIRDLTARERENLDAIYECENERVKGEVIEAKRLWRIAYREKLIKRAQRLGVSLTADELQRIETEAVTALDTGILTGSFLITLEDRTEVTVADILASPSHYHRVQCLDPLEPEYDKYRVVAMIFTDGTPSIFSYAHGEHMFELLPDTDGLDTSKPLPPKGTRTYEGVPSHYQSKLLKANQADIKLASIFTSIR